MKSRVGIERQGDGTFARRRVGGGGLPLMVGVSVGVGLKGPIGAKSWGGKKKKGEALVGKRKKNPYYHFKNSPPLGGTG